MNIKRIFGTAAAGWGYSMGLAALSSIGSEYGLLSATFMSATAIGAVVGSALYESMSPKQLLDGTKSALAMQGLVAMLATLPPGLAVS